MRRATKLREWANNDMYVCAGAANGYAVEAIWCIDRFAMPWPHPFADVSINTKNHMPNRSVLEGR